jgi:hypothetical protein
VVGCRFPSSNRTRPLGSGGFGGTKRQKLMRIDPDPGGVKNDQNRLFLKGRQAVVVAAPLCFTLFFKSAEIVEVPAVS